MKLRIIKRLLITCSAALILVISMPLRNTSASIAPGCSSARPTALKGAITAHGGDFHDYSVDVLIGMDFHNSAGSKIKIDGTAAGSGYSYTDAVNPDLSAQGEPSSTPGNERT